MLTMQQAQAKFISEGGLTGMGVIRPKPEELSDIEKEMANYIEEVITKANENLDKTNSVSTGKLGDSLNFYIETKQGGFTIFFTALDYLKFVDKGVRGVTSSRKNSTSPYQFKHLRPSKSHVTAIEKWIVTNRLSATARDVKKYGGIKKERKAIDATKGRRSLAYAIATSIKKDGLMETGFWTDAFNQTFADFGAKMSAALGRTVTIDLQQMKADIENPQGFKI